MALNQSKTSLSKKMSQSFISYTIMYMITILILIICYFTAFYGIKYAPLTKN